MRFSELHERIAEASGIDPPPESGKWPRWVVVAANTITRDPRDLTHDERKRGAFLALLRLLQRAGSGAQEALVAAHALGGESACIQFVETIAQESST